MAADHPPRHPTGLISDREAAGGDRRRRPQPRPGPGLHRWRALLWVFALAGALSLPGQIEPDAGHPVVAIAEKQWTSGDRAGAVRTLESELKKSRKDRELWTVLGRMQLAQNETVDARTSFKKALRKDPADAYVYQLMAQSWMIEAERDPNVTDAGNGFVSYNNKYTEEQVRRMREKLFIKALKDLDAGLKADPAHPDCLGLKAEVLTQLERWPALLAHTETLPDELAAPRGFFRATALFRLYDVPAAAAELERTMRLQRPTRSFYELAWEIAQAQGDPERIEAARRRKVFYTYIPDYLTLEYTDACYEIIRVLSPEEIRASRDADKSEAGDMKRLEAAEAALSTLKADKSRTGSRLITAVCQAHNFHGSFEDGLYQELGARGETLLLTELLRNSRCACTVNQAGFQLARLKAPETYDLLAPLLSQDTQFHSMGVARALAELGDPRVPVLLCTALRTGGPAEPDSELGSFAAYGSKRNRQEMVLALGRFPASPEAVALLEAQAGDAQLRTYSRAVLYAWEPTSDRWQDLESECGSAGASTLARIADYLEQQKSAKAATLRTLQEQREKQEAEEEAAAQALRLKTQQLRQQGSVSQR